ncbi:hypothetical protein DITRI_Ditri10aG0109900 [Diplodiscus trichospermus]
MGANVDGGCSRGREKSFQNSFIQEQWTLQQLKKKDQLWRPQRGLPEKSVSVLRAWMFQNFLHPYPKDAEKHLLAIKSGLTRSQGLITERIQASVSATVKKRFIYVGDGSADFCPGLKLGGDDFVMPRKDFPVWEL